MAESSEKGSLLSSSNSRKTGNDSLSRLSCCRKFSFGIGGAASIMPNTVLGFYLQIFLLETAQLSPGYVSVVIFVGKLWDAVTDPVIGYLSSKTETRLGRMRPWCVDAFYIDTTVDNGGFGFRLLLSTVPMVAAYVAIWIVPSNATQATLTVYYVFMYCSYQTFLSCFHVPYTALTMYLSTDSGERDSATAYRMVSEVLGTLTGALAQGLSLSIFVDKSECVDIDESKQYISQEKKAYFIGGAIIGFLMIITALSPFFGVQEVKDAAVKQQSLSFFKGLKYTFKQRPFVHLMMIYLCAWLMVSLVQTNLALYAHYVLDMEKEFQYVIILLLSVVVLSIPMWQLCLLRFGKKSTFGIGISLTLPVLFSLLYVNRDYKYLVWIGAVIGGIGMGSAYLVPWYAISIEH
jgi:Na+/melibiose symporter-like transporter